MKDDQTQKEQPKEVKEFKPEEKKVVENDSEDAGSFEEDAEARVKEDKAEEEQKPVEKTDA